MQKILHTHLPRLSVSPRLPLEARQCMYLTAGLCVCM